MAQLVITYPDEHRDRVIEAMCSKFGYDEEEVDLTLTSSSDSRFQRG